LNRVRQEFETVLQAKFEEDPSLRELSRIDLINKVISLDVCQDLEYLNMVLMETLRYQPPATNCTPIWLTEDAKIGKYHLKAYDRITIHYMGLHFNAS
jgi:cytochrome P450